jgi:hypothetical protein
MRKLTAGEEALRPVLRHRGPGVPGAGLSSGDHVCAFYFGPDDRDLLVRLYLRAGLLAGDRCICIVDDDDPDAAAARVRERLAADLPGRGGSLTLTDSDHTYLRPGGFSTEGMIEFLDATVSGALEDGHYSRVRVMGDMSWVLRHPDLVTELFAYEAAVNDFRDRYPQVLLCLYDLERFGARMLDDILRTHPKLLLGDVLVDNPHYVGT